jgi:putative methanogenesis marker protein 17
MMEIKVEGGSDFANESYRKICQDTFRDAGLSSNIDHVFMFCNPKEFIFIIAAKIGRVSRPVTVWDITLQEGKKLRITTEKYAPKLLALLWDKYRDKVEQISRLELLLKLEDNKIKELLDLVLYDPKDDLVTRIFYALDTVLPEGARVRSSIHSTNSVAIIASENPIGEGQKNKAEEIVSKYV